MWEAHQSLRSNQKRAIPSPSSSSTSCKDFLIQRLRKELLHSGKTYDNTSSTCYTMTIINSLWPVILAALLTWSQLTLASELLTLVCGTENPRAPS